MIKAKKTCWLCDRAPAKYMQDHHVVTKAEADEPRVWLCRGCHFLVGRISMFTTLLKDPHKIADLITLARFQARLPDTRTIVKYDPPMV